MAKNDAATLVVGAGNFFTAPVGTTRPVSVSTAPSAPWDNIGHTSLSDIITFSSEGGDATTLGTLQSPALRTTYSARIESFGIQLQQFDRKSLRLYYGSNAPMLASGDLGIPAAPTPTTVAFLAIFVDGTKYFAIYAPKAEIFRSDNVAVKDAESLVSLPLNVKPLVYSTNDWTYSITPLGDIVAGYATAGTPGEFYDVNPVSGGVLAVAPVSLAALTAAITSGNVSPNTAWTTGQYVTLDDGTLAHWNGTAWVAGAA